MSGSKERPLVDALIGLGLLHQDLTRLALFLSSEGPTTFHGELLSCSLPDRQRRLSAMLALGASQSTQSVLRIAKHQGLPVRDAYPIARTAVESFINATYLLCESDQVAERALKYASFAAWRHYNRRFGSGPFSIKIKLGIDPETASKEFPDFMGKGQGNWTTLDVPSRIRRAGELAGSMAGSRLLAAYGLIYYLSSEVIHGTPFGASYFYSMPGKTNPSVEDFKNSTTRQAENILFAVLSASCGYLTAFFNYQKMTAPMTIVEKLFDRLTELNEKPLSAFPPRADAPSPEEEVRGPPV